MAKTNRIQTFLNYFKTIWNILLILTILEFLFITVYISEHAIFKIFILY